MKDQDKPKALDQFVTKHRIHFLAERITYVHQGSHGEILEVHTRPNVDVDDVKYRNFKTYKA